MWYTKYRLSKYYTAFINIKVARVTCWTSSVRWSVVAVFSVTPQNFFSSIYIFTPHGNSCNERPTVCMRVCVLFFYFFYIQSRIIIYNDRSRQKYRRRIRGVWPRWLKSEVQIVGVSMTRYLKRSLFECGLIRNFIIVFDLKSVKNGISEYFVNDR